MECGLVLGGGAAKGLIHIGAYQYLFEKDYTITELAGSSMGAIIAAGIAMKLSPKRLREIAQDTSLRKLIDANLVKGIIQGEKINKILHDIFGDINIEELPIPLRVTATNLLKRELIVYDEGPLIPALRASISIPGIFAPVEGEDGEIIVDGGVMCNLPVQLVNNNNIIAVSATGNKQTQAPKTKDIFGIPLPGSIRNYTSTIMQLTMSLMARQNEERHIEKTDKNITLIRPDLADIKLYDFHKVQECIRRGYQAAHKALAEKEKEKEK